VIIHDKLMITGYPGISPDLPHDAVKGSDGHCFHNLPFEHRSQRTGIFVDLTGVQPAAVVKQGHFGCGAGAARRTIHVGFSVYNCAFAGPCVRVLIVEFGYVHRADLRPLGMINLKCPVGRSMTAIPKEIKR
jgi:hypothetical protein